MPRNLTMGLLPEQKRDWRTFATSYGIEILVLLLLISAGLFFPDELRLSQKYTVTELVPRPDLAPKPVEHKKAVPHPVIKKVIPVPVFAAKLYVPKEIHVQKKKEEEKEAPKLDAKFNAPVLQQNSGLPQKVVYTGSFGSSAPATVSAPIQQVQTGGFGDPNGLKGQGKEGAHLTATQLGSFDLPNGPGTGNGTGGAKGIKGTVASVGFGNGIAQGDNHGGAQVVQTAGFASQEISHVVARSMQADSGPATVPVEIISKPNPIYTEEARQLKLEGEVLLAVMFGANGQLHVDHVVRGLGHGLDEAAVSAANKIRFKPAQRNGTPVDSTAVVHVVFQLAY